MLLVVRNSVRIRPPLQRGQSRLGSLVDATVTMQTIPTVAYGDSCQLDSDNLCENPATSFRTGFVGRLSIRRTCKQK